MSLSATLNRNAVSQRGVVIEKSTLPSQAIDRAVQSIRSASSSNSRNRRNIGNIESDLFDASAHFKIATSQIAMHISKDWRDGLFRQIDSLLDAEEWSAEDIPPMSASSITFLRLMLYLHPAKRPGLAASGNGDLVATWVTGPNKLLVRCLPNDHIRWSLTRVLGDETVRAAGDDKLLRTLVILGAYQPDIWFGHAEPLPR